MTDEALELAEAQVDAWSEQLRQEELRYRYCDDPFCPCTPSKIRFLKLVGVLDDWADRTRYGEQLEYLWNTDPAAQP